MPLLGCEGILIGWRWPGNTRFELFEFARERIAVSAAHRDDIRLPASVEARLDPASRERIDDRKIRDTAPILVALASLGYKTLHDAPCVGERAPSMTGQVNLYDLPTASA